MVEMTTIAPQIVAAMRMTQWMDLWVGLITATIALKKSKSNIIRKQEWSSMESSSYEN